MTTFKPTHRLYSGHLAELEHTFTLRQTGRECGLFFLELGGASIYQMDSVTELPKTIQVAAHEEPEPLRVAPEVGTEFWVIDSLAEDGVGKMVWNGCLINQRILAAGEARATKEDAIAALASRQKARGFA